MNFYSKCAYNGSEIAVSEEEKMTGISYASWARQAMETSEEPIALRNRSASYFEKSDCQQHYGDGSYNPVVSERDSKAFEIAFDEMLEELLKIQNASLNV